MPEPKIAGTRPAVLDLEPGEHYYCACGLSEKQPFCDGAHRGTGFAPMKFVVEEARNAALCMCKRTGNAPFCDGTHAKL